MDKLAALLRPHQMRVRSSDSRRNLAMMGAGLGISAMGILGIEHVLSALVILHVLHAEPSVQFLRREPHLLGYLRGGIARDGAEHVDGIGSIIKEMVDVLLLLRHHSAGLVEKHLLRSDSRLQLANLGVQLVAAVLAYGGQHVAAHPVLERFSLRLV